MPREENEMNEHRVINCNSIPKENPLILIIIYYLAVPRLPGNDFV